MTIPFNLTTEPWIPCERLDGTHVELSTLDALAEAHDLRAIDDSSPLVQAVLHRHLLAVLHRSYAGPKNMKEWGAIAGAKRFDRTRIETYLSSVRDRMDLFHPTHPFAQTRGLVAQYEVRPINELVVERWGWGAGRELFQHRPAEFRSVVAPARAACSLLAYQLFATGGTTARNPGDPCVSVTAAPLVRCAVVVLRGSTLFDTLRSNLLRYDGEREPIPATPEDAPSWEQAPLPEKLAVAKEPERRPKGWLDLLTWLSRRVELAGGPAGVTAWVRAVGQGLVDDGLRDPMVTYRIDEKRGELSVGIDPARAFWRSSAALFEVGREGAARRFRRPVTVDLVASPEARAILGKGAAYSVDVYGLDAYQSKIEAIRAEHVHALARLFNDADARNAVERAIGIAGDAVRALYSALREYGQRALGPGDRDPLNDDVKQFVKSTNAEPAAWSALGPAFDAMMRALEDDIDAAEAGFAEQAIAIVRGEFTRATARSETTARWLKARAHAERSLGRSLAKLRPNDEKTATTTETGA